MEMVVFTAISKAKRHYVQFSLHLTLIYTEYEYGHINIILSN